MDTKLTLKLKDDSISRAKKYISSIGTSLSAIVEDFFDGLTLQQQEGEFKYSPLSAVIFTFAEMKGLTQKYCHAEFISASALDIVHRFRNEFGMTLRNELFGQPHTTPLIFANTFYILRKQLGNEEAKKALRKLRVLIHIINSSEVVVDKALNSDFADFEDAIQYYTSQENDINILLTRNLRDYKNALLIVQTPETFLVSNGLI